MAFIWTDVGDVPYFERPDSPQEAYIDGQVVVKRIFDTPWETRWVFARAVVGFAAAVNNTYVSRIIPVAYQPDGFARFIESPVEPRDTWVYCNGLESIEGVKPTEWDEDELVGVYDRARCTFTFQSLPFRVLTDQESLLLYPNAGIPNVPKDVRFKPSPTSGIYQTDIVRFISKTVQPSAQHLTLPFGKMYFVTTPILPSNNGLVKRVPGGELVYTWHMVPSQDLNNSSQLRKIQAQIGTVNKDIFDNHPSGTLLLTAVNSKPYRMIGGFYASDIELRMRYLNVTDANGVPLDKCHNYFIRFVESSVEPGAPINEKWYEYTLITSNGKANGRKIFDESYFYQLFTLGGPDEGFINP